jgi:hypothetical protein
VVTDESGDSELWQYTREVCDGSSRACQ